MATEFRQGTPLDTTARTARRDMWWVEPLLIFVTFTAFVAYATFRVFENAYFAAGPGHAYLSPFGSPDLTFLTEGWRDRIPVVGVFLGYPAFLILPMPAGFRFTCYYYRKAYYRSFYLSPPACAVNGWGAGTRNYMGEKGILVLQNFHRYFLYAALVILVILTYDVFRSIYTHDVGPDGDRWNFGLGTVILAVNVVLLAAYTLGCHSFRHLVGGKLDCFSCDLKSKARYSLWTRVTVLNGRHMLWALTSLFSVAIADFYVRWLAVNPHVTHFFGVIPV